MKTIVVRSILRLRMFGLLLLIVTSSNSRAIDAIYIRAGIFDPDGIAIKTPFYGARLSNIVLGPNGNIFATEDQGNGWGQLFEFDRAGNYVATVLSSVTRAIAFDSLGNLYVGGNEGGGGIQKYDRNYNLIHSYHIPYYDSESMVIDSANILYFSQHTNSNDGEVGRIDLNTDAINENFITGITLPYGLALDGKGYLYTSGYYTDTIGKYDLSGNAVNTSWISGNANALNTPYRMTFDNSGNLYVTNTNSSYVTGPVGIPGVGWVSKYDSDGNLLNPRLIANIEGNWGILFVPEPSTYLLGVAACTALILSRWHGLVRSRQNQILPGLPGKI